MQDSKAKKNLTVRYIAITGIMAALASVLMMWDFPIAFMFPDFLQFDFSDLPALITAFAIGPVYGVVIELIKNIVHLALTRSGGIGELANFVVGGVFVLCAGVIYKVKPARKTALIGMAAATVIMSITAAFMNYFVLIPMYSKFMPLSAIIEMCAKIVPFIKDTFGVICFSIIPFNLFKGVIISIITFFIYKKISAVLKMSPKS